MKTTIRSFFALCFLFCSGTVLAQDHVLTYVKKTAQVDATVNISGRPHTMVKIPVTELVTGTRYVVMFPAATSFGFTTGIVSTLHSSQAFVPNATIDTFPAQVQVIDGLNYLLNSDGAGSYDFFVTGSTTVSVSIDIGDTIISVSNTLQAMTGVLPFLTNAHLAGTVQNPASANAVPAAEWNKYVDQVDLIAGLDRWIDYIRVTPF